MAINAEQRLQQLAIDLPVCSAPAGNYANAVRTGNLLVLSGKAPCAENGVLPKGRLGEHFSVEEGYVLARSAGLALLAVLRSELGSLDKVQRVVAVQGALNTLPSFEAHAQVMDGASDLLLAVFADKGLHARSVQGVSSLRDGVPLVLRAIVEIA